MPLEPFRKALVGLPVSHVWMGYGSALFIEFGNLTERKRRDGSIGNPDGDITLMIEWSWRIEKPRSILGGSFSSKRRWQNMTSKLLGSVVQDVRTISSIPEIEVSLSNGLRVVSFMTETGQPDWALLARNPSMGALCVKGGRLHVDRRNS